MPKMRVSSFDGQPIFDIASYARRGPARRDRLSPAELAQISRTVNRAPEVVVKVLPKGSNDLRSIARHFGYIGRYGDVDLETDDGQPMRGRDVGRHLLEDWDLDLDERRGGTALAPAGWRRPPKLVHKLMLSMPAGTPAAAVLAAARSFLREQFAFKHRYAFVLHTDEPHPHVHAVVKAVSEQGMRLNITKATLREWRSEFARHLRLQGIEANATERAVRGAVMAHKSDGIYRAARRGASTHMRLRVASIAAELEAGKLQVESSKHKLLQTRADVLRGWGVMKGLLERQGQSQLATDVARFTASMVSPGTERELIARKLIQRAQESGPREVRPLSR